MPVRSANIAFSIAIIVACAVFGKIALGFEDPPALVGAQVGANVFPLISLGCIALFAAINIFNYSRGNPEEEDARIDVDKFVLLRVGTVIVILFASYFLWIWIGFIPTSIFMPIAIALVMQVRSLLTYVLLAVYGPCLWAVFRYVLGLNL
jgi:hypothetical protein